MTMAPSPVPRYRACAWGDEWFIHDTVAGRFRRMIGQTSPSMLAKAMNIAEERGTVEDVSSFDDWMARPRATWQ